MNTQVNTDLNTSTSPDVLAHMMDADAAFDVEQEKIVAAGETGKRAAVFNCLHFRRRYTDAQLAVMPVPGSEAGKEGVPEKPNFLVDKYREEINGVEVEQAWWQRFADALAIGNRIRWHRDAIKGVMASDPMWIDESKGGEGAKAARELYGRIASDGSWNALPTATLEKRLQMWQTRRTRIAAVCRKAWNIHTHWREIEATLGAIVSIDFVWVDAEAPEGERELDEVSYPIRVSSKIVAGLFSDLSDNEFLALDIDKARIGGNATFATLMSSGKKTKTPKAGQGNVAPNAPGKVAVTLSNWGDTFNQVSSWCKDPDEQERFMKWLATTTKNKPADLDDPLLAMDAVRMWLDNVLAPYEKHIGVLIGKQKDKLAAEIAAAAAKLQANG